MKDNTCRNCGNVLKYIFVDLGMSPLSNAFLRKKDLQEKEIFYPLQVYVCHHCFLVQLQEFQPPEHIFNDYAYFSSYSATWLQHAQHYVEMAVSRFSLNEETRVLEIASNDGYLLQYFKPFGIPVLGIEPASNVAQAALEKGIPTLVDFFSLRLAEGLVTKGLKADLVVGNNVLAHVPNLNDVVAGLKVILKPNGVITLEFPHLMCLLRENQFDTIYHEHFSYFSLTTVRKVLAKHALKVYDLDELPTHGGSLRVYACHAADEGKAVQKRVTTLLATEKSYGMTTLDLYQSFAEKVATVKMDLLDLLIKIKRQGKSVVGYGAPAKGNTLLNYCGIRADFIDYTVDRNPHKQGLYLPGTHIPVARPEKIFSTKPDFLLILPWNLRDEVMETMSSIRNWGGQFIVPIPALTVM